MGSAVTLARIPRRVTVMRLLVVVVSLAGAATASGQTLPGVIAQLPGAAGCIVNEPDSDVATCDNNGRALHMYGWGDLRVSPDGRNVYVAAANTDAFAVFDRAPATGALAQKPGTAGCAVNEPSPDVTGCNNAARGIGFASSVDISPDGKNAYVAGYNSGAVAVFDRDVDTGALTQKAGADGCIVDATATPIGGCDNTGRALTGARMVRVSPDGLNLYVTSDASDSVAVFDRDTTTGALTQKAGAAGCVVNAATLDVPGCDNTGRAMSFSRGLAVSPDGKSVYVAALISDAIVVFDRDLVSGALSQAAGTAGCVQDQAAPDTQGCAHTGRALDGPLTVAVSPGGESVYAASAISDAVAAFDRGSNGTLTQKANAAGCTVNALSADVPDCDNTGRALESVTEVAVSSDGASVDTGGQDGVGAFDRDTTTGALTQRQGAEGCITDVTAPIAGCDGSGRAIHVIQAIGLSPDGKNLYGSSVDANSVAAFRRDLVPVCQSVTTLVAHNAVSPIGLSCFDPNGDPVVLSIAGDAVHGSTGAIDQGAAQVVYSPDAGFAGADAFSYRATANGAVSADAPVSLTVQPGSPPVCAAQARSLLEGGAATLALSCAAGGDPFTYGIAGAPGHGTLAEIASNGLVGYTPAAGFSGNDGFTYHATSAFGQSPDANFVLDVLPSAMGPAGAPGPPGPPAFKLVVALFESRLRAAAGNRVTLRYVSTMAADARLAVLRGRKVIARLRRPARVGANAIVWNGRIGRKAAPPGLHKLRLTLTSGDQTVTRTASLQVVARRR